MKRLLFMILALLCLTSCSSMLEREAIYTSPHAENPPASAVDAYRVSTYSGLCASLQSYLEEGVTEGNLRFPATYPGNLTVDLEKAKRELMEEEPLGCYALRDITFHINRIIAYYEVTASFDYRVPPAEYMAIQTAHSEEALDEAMRSVLEDFNSGLTVLVDIPGGGEEPIADSLRRVYDAHPELALGYPEIKVVSYPQNSPRAVAEIAFTYPESVTVLRLRQRSMLRSAQTLAAELVEVEDEAFYDAVMSRWRLEPGGATDAAGALLEGAADQEGLDRAFALVSQYRDAHKDGEGGEKP